MEIAPSRIGSGGKTREQENLSLVIIIIIKKNHGRRLKAHVSSAMTNGLSTPPRNSFPTSFATESERLKCLIYAGELCMNPSEAADLQITQAG